MNLIALRADIDGTNVDGHGAGSSGKCLASAAMIALTVRAWLPALLSIAIVAAS